MLKIIILIFLCCNVWANDSFPPPFTAKYSLYAKGLPVGKGTRSLIAHENGKFEFISMAKTTGLAAFFRKISIKEQSIFTRINNKIQPLEYLYRQTGKKSRLRIVLFDWLKNIATNKFKDQIRHIPLEEDTLDKLLYQVVLMQELQEGKRELKYKVANKGKVSIYIPKFLGTESIKTGLGKFETLKYERASGNRRTTLWCAAKLHYLPVQVEHVEKDGNVFKMLLQWVHGL
ncbi:DUF3108 domain-containing protein [Candidatus Halobeggiatoa sp. HSG11]|nr:DUF3108 domain-containing protein [Candidatus Halobeggiatoa sp. HSG11]